MEKGIVEEWGFDCIPVFVLCLTRSDSTNPSPVRVRGGEVGTVVDWPRLLLIISARLVVDKSEWKERWTASEIVLTTGYE